MLATIALFLSLGLDTLAVAIGLGVRGLPRARWFRIGATFALFEGVMPIVGLLIGQQLSGPLGAIATYTAGALLIALGAWEIREALVDDDKADKVDKVDAGGSGTVATVTDTEHHGMAELHSRAILLTGLSVSLDELAVGFSLGLLGVALGPALLYIAAQAFVLTFAGLWLGTRIGAQLGERAELAAGIVLALLGVALVVSEATSVHLL